MLPHANLIPFLITVCVLVVIPGPSVVFTVSRGVALGRRAALATVAGNTSGLMLQLLVVVIGLGSLLARSETILVVMKLLGGAYLIFLGVRSIRSRRELAELLTPAATQMRSLRTTIREGFVVGATNPKGLAIFTAVVPTFVDRAQGHATLQLATLGAICGLLGAVTDSTWAIASGTARAWLARSPRRLEWLSVGGGVTMVALGVGLAVTGRRR